MKTVRVLVVVAAIATVIAAVRVNNYFEAQRWLITVEHVAPIYENDDYPYGSASRPNRVIAKLSPGEKPKVVAVGGGKDWVSWTVELPSGQRGYLFDPDVKSRRKGANDA